MRRRPQPGAPGRNTRKLVMEDGEGSANARALDGQFG
jgi:hypothetical protein